MTTGDGDQARGDDHGGDAGATRDAGEAGARAMGPTPARRRKRASPPEHPEKPAGEAQTTTAIPTHAQNPVSIEMGLPAQKNYDLDPLPVPSDEEIDAWLGSVGEPLENLREERFCHEFIQDYNVKKALIRSGFSEQWASSLGMKFVRRPHITRRINELQSAVCRNLDITAERVAQELAAVGFSRVSDFVEITPGGKLHIKDFARLRDDQLAALDEIKVDPETGCISAIKVHPKMPALDMLGKHLRMWDKDDNKKRGTTFNLNVTIGGDGRPSAPIIEGSSEPVDD